MLIKGIGPRFTQCCCKATARRSVARLGVEEELALDGRKDGEEAAACESVEGVLGDVDADADGDSDGDGEDANGVEVSDKGEQVEVEGDDEVEDDEVWAKGSTFQTDATSEDGDQLVAATAGVP